MNKLIGTWTLQSLAYLVAFKAKLQKKNPNAEMEFLGVQIFFVCACFFSSRSLVRESESQGMYFLLCPLRERASAGVWRV